MKRILLLLIPLYLFLAFDNSINTMQKRSKKFRSSQVINNAKTQNPIKIRNLNSKWDKKFVLRCLENDCANLIGGSGDYTTKFEDHFNLLKSHRTKILVVCGKKAGIICYNKLGYIYLIYICDEFRHRGYANKLLEFVEKRLVQNFSVTTLTLDVFNYNTLGRRFFEKAGFKYEKENGLLIRLTKKL